MQAEARRRGLGRAQVVHLVMDSVVWLWDLADDRLATALKTLDFHHARDHLWAMAHWLHGQDTPEARAWVQPLLKSLRTDGEARGLRRVEQLLADPEERPAATQAELEREVRFLQTYRDHLHYQAMADAGAPRGSGAAESLGKQLQQRLRGCGQAWSRSGLTHLLRVCIVVKTVMTHSSGTEICRQPGDAPRQVRLRRMDWKPVPKCPNFNREERNHP